MENPIVRIILDNEEKIDIELYPNIAPKSVENFLKLVEEKYFDGVCFHRVIENFMIQTGGYYLDGNKLIDKEERETIKGEFKANGFVNNLKHNPGVISMARTSDMNSGSTQFFICSASTPHLDGQYAAFGKTVDDESLDSVLRVSKAPTVNVGAGLTDFPYPPISIKSIRRIK